MAAADEVIGEWRSLFAEDVDAYELGRPGYPDRVYALLRDVCGLGDGSRVLEIGPGTGQATGALLDHGARVTAVELGAALADRLQAKFPGRALDVRVGAFETVELPASAFDLVVAATSFHWVPTEPGLQRCAAVLRDGGWLALWWTYFGDPARPDPFDDALQPILAEIAPELLDAGAGARAHVLDAAARISEIAATGCFAPVRHEVVAWTGRHTSIQLRAMFASFSPWLALAQPQRVAALDALQALADEEFGGVVDRPYLTAVYLAQRTRV